ncbi:MAG: LuxR C-terminal-related transcriptional regulator [Ilumatobacteraceae bacterium]
METTIDPGHRAPRREVRTVGRDVEVARFRDLLASSRTGVVLHGATGVGKTRLAADLVELASELGHVARFISGRGSTTDLPLAPFAPLMPAGFAWSEGVSLLVTARSEVERLGSGSPVVLGVDDAHLLDPASATLVHQLVSTGAARLVATVRDDEWVPQPIVELWRTGMVERWSVGKLNDAHVLEVIVAELGSDLPLRVADDAVRLCAGNPLYATTLARAITERGVESFDDLRQATTAPTIVDFVESELRTLTPSMRDALSIVALAEPIAVELLDAVLDGPALIELERRGWISIADSGLRSEVRLTHPLIGEVLRHTMSRLLARSVYRDLAEAIRARGARRREDRLRVVLWSLESGGGLASAELVAAARDAIGAGDPALAHRLAEAAWEADRSVDAGLLLLSLGSPVAARGARGLGAELERTVSLPQQRAMLTWASAFDAFMADGDMSLATRHVEQALLQTDEPQHRAQLHGQEALLCAHGGDLRRARELVATARSLLPEGDLFSVAHAACIIAVVEGRLDTTTAALIDEIERAPTFDLGVGPFAPCAVHAVLTKLLVTDGQIERAERFARRAVAEGANDRRLAYMPEAWLGHALLWRGRTLEGYQWARKAAELQRSAGLVTAERWSRLTMLTGAAYMGDLDLARAALAEMERLPDGPSTFRLGDELYARSVLAEVEGDLTRSIDFAHAGVADGVERGAFYDELVGWMSLAWLDPPQADADRAVELGRLIGGLGTWYADYTVGRVTNDPKLIGRSVDGLMSCGCSLVATGFAAHASTAAASHGDHRAAARWSRRATEIAAGIEVVSVFAPIPGAEPLSRREREVAELAAEGLSGRAIGDRLFLSTRTVDNHLARIYAKLGIEGRSELAAALAAG